MPWNALLDLIAVMLPSLRWREIENPIHGMSPNHILVFSEGTGVTCRSVFLPRGGNRQFCIVLSKEETLHCHCPQSVLHVVSPLDIAWAKLLGWKVESTKSKKGHLQSKNDIDFKKQEQTCHLERAKRL